jgi:hypothetical protein
MGKQKLANDATALTAGAVCQTPDIAHVFVKTRQFLRNGRFGGGILRSYAVSSQHFQQLGECSAQFTLSRGQGADVSGTVVLTTLPRIAPRMPICFIKRATVHRATSKRSRSIYCHALRTP